MKPVKKLFISLKNDNRGVSLTEIMITMSIILTTASVAAGQYDDATAMARDAQRLSNTQEMSKALDVYNLENNSYPVCGENNQATAECYNKIKTLLAPGYITEVPNDPINDNTYQFKYYSNGERMNIEFETEDADDASPRIIQGRF